MIAIKNILEQSLEMLSMKKKQQAALVLTLAFMIYFGGLFLLFWVNLNAHYLKSEPRIRIVLYWKKVDRTKFESGLKEIKTYKDIRVEKIYTPSQALDILKHTGLTIPSVQGAPSENPLSYTVVLGTDVKGKNFYYLIERLKKIDGVDEVIFSKRELEIKRAWLRMARYSTILVLIILAKVMGFIIFVSYSLLKSMRTREIKILWLLGASRSFIRLPIILNALFLSLFSFALGSFLVKLTQITINRFSYTPPLWIRIEFFPLDVFLGFLGVVLLISLMGSYLAVRNIDPL